MNDEMDIEKHLEFEGGENASVIISTEAQNCLQSLMRIWFEFERDLNQVPIISRLEYGTFTKLDYLNLLLNLRQQVIEGARWITRCASSFNRDYADVRSIVIGHAQEEHRDYIILEQDYVAAGGQLVDIEAYAKNAGSEALHAILCPRPSIIHIAPTKSTGFS
jgi:3-oxoacyl-[acyl-carrier-protein] synthase-3